MDLETSKSYDHEEIEDGELSDGSEGYTPLRRPETIPTENIRAPAVAAVINACAMEDTQIYDSESESECTDSSSSSDSDDVMKLKDKKSIKKKENYKRTVLLRVEPMQKFQDQKTKFKKYDIWTRSIEEDSLMENMQGIGVDKTSKHDRNVENYDYSIKYRLNGENALKRRLRNSDDDDEVLSADDKNLYHHSKRTKATGNYNENSSVKKRLGFRTHSRGGDNELGNSPRQIFDLDIKDDTTDVDIATQIANKLYEEKDELLIRIVQVLGRNIPIDLFKETQRIEMDGGMMIMNGERRRTPGGVFLFLLKHHDIITAEQKREIFLEERKNSVKAQKSMQALKRDKKVEELKKRLSEKEKALTRLTTRAETTTTKKSSHLKPESTTLSNPPPSPVANGGQEHSPEYKLHAINHVSDVTPEKSSNSRISNEVDHESLTAYDDFLDMTGAGDEMDLF